MQFFFFCMLQAPLNSKIKFLAVDKVRVCVCYNNPETNYRMKTQFLNWNHMRICIRFYIWRPKIFMRSQSSQNFLTDDAFLNMWDLNFNSYFKISKMSLFCAKIPNFIFKFSYFIWYISKGNICASGSTNRIKTSWEEKENPWLSWHFFFFFFGLPAELRNRTVNFIQTE